MAVNDRAEILSAVTGEPSNIAAFGPVINLSSLGVDAVAKSVWSRPNVFLRGAHLTGFCRTNGAITEQLGTTYGEPEENRTLAAITQDPIWTFEVTTPDMGPDHTVFSGATLALPPGNYGSVSVYSGGTLELTEPGTYHFVNLYISPNSTVNLAPGSVDAPLVYVTNNLLLHGDFGRPGLVLGYFGPFNLHIEGKYTGSLLMAPDAQVEVKKDVTSAIYAETIIVHQQLKVTVPVLDQALLERVGIIPTEVVESPGQMSLEDGTEAEISSALLTPQMNPACTDDRVFMSYQGATLFHRLVSTISTSSPDFTEPQLPTAPAPAGCIGSLFPFEPGSNPDPQILPPPYPILPGGTPLYSDSLVGTDNLMTRLPGGKVLQAGFGARFCDDPAPPQGPNCPALQPGSGAGCNPSLVTGICSYPAAGTPFPGDPPLPGDSCDCADGTSLWECKSRRRPEAGVLGLRMSTDCGNTWTAGAFDPYELSIPGPARAVDRPEIYYDAFDDKLYVSTITTLGFGFPDKQVVYAADAAGLTDSSSLDFDEVDTRPYFTAPEVTTTVFDDRALLSQAPATYGAYTHLVAARCEAGRARVKVYTPFGTEEWDVGEGDPTASCTEVPVGEGGQPFRGFHFGPSIARVPSVPPKVLVAFTSVSDTTPQFTTLRVYSVALRSGGGYTTSPVRKKEFDLDLSLLDTHVLFPQLIGSDGLGGSDPKQDTPIVLRYMTVTPNLELVQEQAVVLYSGLEGPTHLITSWQLSDVFGSNCLPGGCFVGDYRYGAFHEESGGTLSYFTPWTGEAQLGFGLRAHAGFLHVTP